MTCRLPQKHLQSKIELNKRAKKRKNKKTKAADYFPDLSVCLSRTLEEQSGPMTVGIIDGSRINLFFGGLLREVGVPL